MKIQKRSESNVLGNLHSKKARLTTDGTHLCREITPDHCSDEATGQGLFLCFLRSGPISGFFLALLAAAEAVFGGGEAFPAPEALAEIAGGGEA